MSGNSFSLPSVLFSFRSCVISDPSTCQHVAHHMWPKAISVRLPKNYLSCAKVCIGDSRFSQDLHKDKRLTSSKETEERNIQQHSIHHRSESSRVEFVDQHRPARPNDHVFADSRIEASLMAVGHFAKIFDLGKKGSQLTNEFCNDNEE